MRVPDLELPDLEGRTHALAAFRGAPFVLMFLSSRCAFSVQMSPRLAELPAEPRVVVVGAGRLDDLRALAEAHSWRADVLFDESLAAAQSLGVEETPAGYAVDANGEVVSDLLRGADELLEAAGVAATGLRTRDVSHSRISRGGLVAGTPAPDFTLPDLEGNKHRLSDLRGRRVLLVFSDAGCGPCQLMVPDLMRVHAEHPELQVVMVSRGEIEANREKALEHGVTFPVLLQRSREVSRTYAMFATPAGYLVDEDGVIAADVAVGAGDVLALAENA